MKTCQDGYQDDVRKACEYLDKALDFIVEREEAGDYICERMHEIPEEYEVCANECQNLNRNCVLRFLKRRL